MGVPTTLKTPGVYIDEKNAFPNSVVAVETAVPAFLGYTEQAEFGGQSLKNKPVRIESFMEFELFFGKGFKTTYDLKEVEPEEQPKNYDFKIKDSAFAIEEVAGTKFNLYDSLKFFYQNGGGSCFVISVGSYSDTGKDQPFTSTTPFMDGIDLLKKETEPTMIVIPDAVLFDPDDCYSLQVQMLKHCGEQMNRVAILDIYNGHMGLDNPLYNPIDEFRDQVASNSLDYGAAYYPWLHTTIVQASEVNHKNLSDDGLEKLTAICTEAIGNLKPEKRAALTNYVQLLSSHPQTIAMRNVQAEINKDPNSKVLALTDLIISRIKAENDLNEALGNTTPAKGTETRKAGAKLAEAKSGYEGFLKDSKNIPDDIKDSVKKITDAIGGLETELTAAKDDPDKRKKALDKIYDDGAKKFKAPILSELEGANTNLQKLNSDLESATKDRETYYDSLAADPKSFGETAKFELSDAQDGLARAKAAMAEAKDLPEDEGDSTDKAKAVEAAQANIDASNDAMVKAKDKLNIAKGSPDPATVNNALGIAIPEYKLVIEQILKKKNLLPPSAAMAGIYSLVDSERGVWKAPANVAVSSVVAPAVLIDYEQQEDLNAPLQGKAVCAIRPFIGIGTMVWGARTLDANSLDWRYMNVRRTIIMLEQSIKFAAKAYVFEPNVKNTWVSIESMISNFLTNLWKQGALAGAVPADAFSVTVGLGTTMTSNDILEGRMNIEVRVAISHPAEFIVITFQQQQQKS